MGDKSKKRKLLKITDNDGLIQEEDGSLWKVEKYGPGHNIHYIQIDPDEYDSRIKSMASRIASHPEVNLLDVIKDALYDLPLRVLDKVEARLNEAETIAVKKKTVADIKTETKNRGTCVNLLINGRHALNLRE